jgi:hypothetical protein
MNKVAILYWEPGSCGDFVYSLLLANPREYHGVVNFSSVNGHGRINPTILPFFSNNFDYEPGRWYRRTWTNTDITMLNKFVTNTQTCMVVPTHRLDQAQFLQSQISGSTIFGITYPTNMFPLVLKNWCKKVVPDNTDLQKIYNQPIHQYFRNKNIFGEFVLSEQLKFGSNIKSSVEANFDVNISLEDIYSKNLATLNSLFIDHTHVKDMFDSWFALQSSVHQYQYNIPEILQQALGYNSTAEYADTLDIELDSFDNTLIQHQTQLNSKKHFKTLQQAAEFLKVKQQ